LLSKAGKEYGTMPRLTMTVAVQATPKLTPALRAKAAALLKGIKAKQAQIEKLAEDIAKEKEKIELAFDAANAYALITAEEPLVIGEIDGLPVSIKVQEGTTRTLNKKKLMRLFDLTQADLETATDEKPKKPFLGIYWKKAEAEDE
jgi:hypothetical protein